MRERPAGSATPLHKLIWDSAKNESAILAGGMPAVIVASALTVAGISLWLSVLFDLGTDIVVLVLVGLLAGLRAGVHGWRLSAEALSAAIMGGSLAALLVSLHRHSASRGVRRADEAPAPPPGGVTGPASPAAGPAEEPQNRLGARCGHGMR